MKQKILLFHVLQILTTKMTLFDSEDDYRAGCQNVSHCQQQQSYSGLRSTDDQTQPTFEMTLGFKPFTTKIMFVDSDVSYN